MENCANTKTQQRLNWGQIEFGGIFSRFAPRLLSLATTRPFLKRRRVFQVTVFQTRFKPKATLPLCLSQCDDTQQMRCFESIFSADIKTRMRGCLLPRPHCSTVMVSEGSHISSFTADLHLSLYLIYSRNYTIFPKCYVSVLWYLKDISIHNFILVDASASSCTCCICLCDLSEKCAISVTLHVCVM